MRVLYDTRTVHPLDRYEYYRVGAGSEIAPVLIPGRSPGSLLATMSVARVAEFEIEATSWAADTEGTTLRTHRMIRASDPECYRLCVSVNGGIGVAQAGNQVSLRARDIALFDTSRPWIARHMRQPVPMRLAMLTFPRALLSVAPAKVQPVVGTVIPRNLPGRDTIADFLIGLADAAGQPADTGLADALRDCVTGLVHQRLGLPNGITSQTHRLLRMAHVRRIIRQRHGDPNLDVEGIARAAQMSPRYLHKLFQGAELTPMQLLKRLRLEECHRSLLDPALMSRPVKDVIAAHGYLRADQFARDFKQLFGVSATQVRESAREQLAELRR